MPAGNSSQINTALENATIAATNWTLPWGLDRLNQVRSERAIHERRASDREIDRAACVVRLMQRSLPLDNTWAAAEGNAGAGVDVYTIDTGVRHSHQEFGGRARVSLLPSRRVRLLLPLWSSRRVRC